MDFSDPRQQVLAKFVNSKDTRTRRLFFHQLVLSVELYLRIHSPNIYSEADRSKVLSQLPLKIAWDLAVAQRWLENVFISKADIGESSPGRTTFGFGLRTKNRQKEALQVFMDYMKWPNKLAVEEALLERDYRARPVEDRSADAWSWFSGAILPGPTLPWLLMNSLIDCDPGSSDKLYYLTHMAPSSGFQYRTSTYWSSCCIVGKVLGAARGVSEAAGWIGPCQYSSDLSRIECVRVRQLPALDTPLLAEDIISMKVRSSPLGPIADAYPVNDYELVAADMEEIPDVVRIQKLGFRATGEHARTSGGINLEKSQPLMKDAAIVFACEGETLSMKLRYDVDFITAFPCHEGPHGKTVDLELAFDLVLIVILPQYFSGTMPTMLSKLMAISPAYTTGPTATDLIRSRSPPKFPFRLDRQRQIIEFQKIVGQHLSSTRSWSLRASASQITKSSPVPGAHIGA